MDCAIRVLIYLDSLIRNLTNNLNDICFKINSLLRIKNML